MPDLRQWSLSSDDDRIRRLCLLAAAFDRDRSPEDKLFSRAGKLYAPKWFKEVLRDWQTDPSTRKTLEDSMEKLD
jgi:hypothetical protein